MIAKAGRGSGFAGLTRYLLNGRQTEPNPDRVLWTSTRELVLEEPRQAAQLMRSTANLGNSEKPVYHMSVSLAPGEHLSREQWEAVVDTTLKDLGLGGHQALVVAHRDTPHEHVHIVVNRVHPETLKSWQPWQDWPRLRASLRSQELALGLQPTPHVKDPDRVPSEVLQQYERTGEPPLLDYARAAARPVFEQARTWSEAHERLAERGLFLERKGQGLVVTDDHRHVKASSVDRSASLKSLEGRLGPFEPRRAVLREVDADLRGDRRSELTVAVVPVHQARSESAAALSESHLAGCRLDKALAGVRALIAEAYREAPQVESRYLQHLTQDKAVPQVLPAQLGALKGTVVRAGSLHIPLGAEGARAFDLAAHQLPQLATSYLRAQEALTQAQAHLSTTRQNEEQISQRLQPQLEELARIEHRAGRLYEEVLTLRPREQIALARAHGPEILEKAARRRPQIAQEAVAHRQAWIRDLAPDLSRALDRRLSRTGLSLPESHHSPVEWAREAGRRGLNPLHTVQALTRSGLPVAEALQALNVARTTLRHPIKSAVRLTAKALGLPALPVRLAVMAWNKLERSLSR